MKIRVIAISLLLLLVVGGMLATIQRQIYATANLAFCGTTKMWNALLISNKKIADRQHAAEREW
ncbi:MAG: hypothetical protein AAGJ82_06780 [Bacteroidota bacterium]